MTQIKEGLIKSQAYTHVDMKSEGNTLSRDKKPSEELLRMFDDAATEIENMVLVCQQLKMIFRRDGISEESGRRLAKEKLNASPELVDACFDKDYDIILNIMTKEALE